jgi:hypothetical protein
MRKALLNNNKDYGAPRFSNTSNIEQHIPEFQEQSIEFIQFLESYLKDMGNAYDVLLQLAKRPISIRRAIDGLSWEEITESLDSNFKTPSPKDSLVEDVLSAIDLSHVLGAESKEAWLTEVSEIFGADSLLVKSVIVNLQKDNIITWSNKTNSFIRV